MRHFNREFHISKESDLDEIKRLSRNLKKKYQIGVSVHNCVWNRTKKILEIKSINYEQYEQFDFGVNAVLETVNIDIENLKFHVRLETGKNVYSIGILKGYQLKFYNSSPYNRISAYVKFDTPDGVKILKRFIDCITYMPADSELRFIALTKKELKVMKEKLVTFKTNKFGREMTIGTLIVAWNSSSKQMYYGKITKMLETYFEYSIPDGTTKRCYNPNMVYVPENQEEFEFELSMEILKS